MNSEPWRDPLQELWQRQPVPVATAPAEERVLRDRFAEFDAYAARVRRWL